MSTTSDALHFTAHALFLKNMAWITLVEADIKTALAGGEFAAYTTRALSAGQANPLPEQLGRVTRQIRGYVAACDANALGPDGTIPDELEGAAVDMVACALISRLPLPDSMTERLQRRQEDALRLLRDVAACKFAVEQPPADEASDEDIPGSGTPRITTKTLRYTSAHQDGI